jgi:hypothetical protein
VNTLVANEGVECSWVSECWLRAPADFPEWGESFALMLLTSPEKVGLNMENNSASQRATYPAFDQANRAFSYRVAYYLGQGSEDEIENVFNRLKAQMERQNRPSAPRKVKSYPSP